MQIPAQGTSCCPCATCHPGTAVPGSPLRADGSSSPFFPGGFSCLFRPERNLITQMGQGGSRIDSLVLRQRGKVPKISLGASIRAQLTVVLVCTGGDWSCSYLGVTGSQNSALISHFPLFICLTHTSCEQPVPIRAPSQLKPSGLQINEIFPTVLQLQESLLGGIPPLRLGAAFLMDLGRAFL